MTQLYTCAHDVGPLTGYCLVGRIAHQEMFVPHLEKPVDAARYPGKTGSTDSAQKFSCVTVMC